MLVLYEYEALVKLKSFLRKSKHILKQVRCHLQCKKICWSMSWFRKKIRNLEIPTWKHNVVSVIYFKISWEYVDLWVTSQKECLAVICVYKKKNGTNLTVNVLISEKWLIGSILNLCPYPIYAKPVFSGS